jgi:hypothetical protein
MQDLPRDDGKPPYETPGLGVRAAGDLPLAMAYMLAYFVVGGVFYWAVPGIENHYRDFKIEPPAISRAVLNFAHWFRDGYGWLMLLPIPIGLPLGALKLGSRVGAPRAARRMVHLSSIFLLAAAILVIASLIMPMMTMAPRAVGGGR